MNIYEKGYIKFKTDIMLKESACSGGKLEKDGPLGKYLDKYFESDDLGTGSFEKAEAEMVKQTVKALLEKSDKSEKDINLILAGDLMNQCTSTGYGLEEFEIPYLGLYGACSTFALGILTAGVLIDSGHIQNAIVVASSNFCTAERQFRFPLEYGSVMGTTAQTTVTGTGAVLLEKASSDESGTFLNDGMFGIVSDAGIKDAANMGAAMANAASDTILRYLKNTNKNACDFDILATGDLGKEGHSIVKEMLQEKGQKTDEKFKDCGTLIFDIENGNVGCGGSGCGCSGVVMSGYFNRLLKEKKINTLSLVGTGALMSKQSLLQGLSIPAIAHLVTFENR